MKQEEERYCGNCCWFHGETTDGEGLCAYNPLFDLFSNRCSSPACADYISRQEMRHHIAVLLQWRRVVENPLIHRLADYSDVEKAQRFSYRYMKVFSKL